MRTAFCWIGEPEDSGRSCLFGIVQLLEGRLAAGLSEKEGKEKKRQRVSETSKRMKPSGRVHPGAVASRVACAWREG